MQTIEELRKELTAPIKSIRIFAIENAIRPGCPPEVEQCLKDCLKLEKDPECIILLEHAISQFSAKHETDASTALTPENYETAFIKANARDQLALTTALKPVHLKNLDIETLVPKLLSTAKDPVVSGEIVKKFRRYWPQSQLGFLETNAFAKTKSLQIACIETLVKNYPESLKQHLSKLVFINDPVIRSLAIRGMAKHFPELAAEFIRECFDKGDYYNKVTALKICSTIDFSLIRDNLLKLMFKDPEMKIFELCCTILMANPDKEVPFRLIYFMQKTTAEKAEILRKFIGQYCKTIEIAKLCEDFSAYIGFLNDYPKMLAARNFINEALANYQQDDEETRISALNHLSRHLGNKFVVDELQQFIEKCSDESLKKALTMLTSKAEDSKNSIPAEKPATTSSEQQTPQQIESALLKELAKTRFNKNPETAEKVKKILSSSSGYSEAVITAALKAAANLHIAGFSNYAKTAIKSGNEKLIIAALEYLSQLDKEEFQQQIQKLINTEMQLVRINLIRITSQELPDYAVFLVKHMLENKDPAIRKNGLEAAINIEFHHLLPVLSVMLEKEDDPILIESAIALFLANPVLDSIYIFKVLEQKNSGHFMTFEKAGKELQKLLNKTGIATDKEIESFLQQKRTEQQEKKVRVAKEKEYEQQLSDLKSALNWDSISGSIEELKNMNWKRNIAILIGLFLLLNLISYLFMNKSIDETPDLAMKPVLAKITRYEVEVLELYPKTGTALVKTMTEPCKSFFTPAERLFFVIAPGEKLSVKGRPYKRNSEGHIFVETGEIIKLKTGSKNE